jgi:penicillin amidase
MERRRHLVRLLLLSLFAIFLLYAGSFGLAWKATIPALGDLLDPLDGVYRTARLADHQGNEQMSLKGLSQTVNIKRDHRGIPHIFAQNDADAVRAVGFVTAQDRLFQLDFLPRVAQGRLSEVLGKQTLDKDKFLRSTGMEWGARKNLASLKQTDPKQIQVLEWFAEGVNQYLDQVSEKDLPLEFRLLHYKPRRYQPLYTLLMLQYMNYDLSWKSDDIMYGRIRKAIGDSSFTALFPQFSTLYVPISPEMKGITPQGRAVMGAANTTPSAMPKSQAADHLEAMQRSLAGTILEGYQDGKGSNNWAISGSHSNSNFPILAGDPHLKVTLPSIWYEMHVVTPTMNTYGVAVPGSPMPIIGFNSNMAWTFTNTDTDQIDYYQLTLDKAKKKYKYMDGWRDLTSVIDTIRVKGSADVIDTLRYAHWGTVIMDKGDAVAVQWTAHKPNGIMNAIWGFNHAQTFDEFQQALRHFDAPMQNCMYADRFGNIAVRSSGYLPIRKVSYAGGLLDGSSDAGEWIGRVPFEELPSSYNPDQGYLSSTNQQPAPADYPYYQRITWNDSFRSLRIDSLLRSKPKQEVEDMKRYQRDVHAVQFDLLKPFLMSDSLKNISSKAQNVRQSLLKWDGNTETNAVQPLLLDVLIKSLKLQTWDEFQTAWRKPELSTLMLMLQNQPQEKWFDVLNTPKKENGYDVLASALDATADSLSQRYQNGNTTWGAQHQIRFDHILEALKALGRGPFPFSGFANTLSPAKERVTKATASWRMIVDFDGGKPKGYGIFPGGASGNPFSRFYTANLSTYLNFDYYDLDRPQKPEEVYGSTSSLVLSPN